MSPTYTCEHCSYTTPKRSNYTRHMRTHQIVDTTFQCSYCCNEFSSQYNLQRHLDNVSCEEYKQHLLQLRQKVDQRARENGEKVSGSSNEGQEVSLDRHKCPTCYKAFTTKRRLSSHICQHIQHPLQCPKCLFIFAHKSSKSRHVQACNGSSPQQACVGSTPTSVTTNITNAHTINNNQHNYNLYINLEHQKPVNYGEQTVDHIPHAYIRRCFGHLNGTGVAMLAKAIFLDPNVPKNHNVKLKTTKRLTFDVYQNDEWANRNGDEVLRDIISFVGCHALTWYMSDEFADVRESDEDSKSIRNELLNVKNKSRGSYAQTRDRLISIFLNARDEEKRKEKELLKQALQLQSTGV